MNTAELIYRKVKALPEFEALEVLEFVEALTRNPQGGEDETAYLLRAPANARDLLQAAKEIREGKGFQPRALLPDD
jgi:hypothetical protein